MADYPVKIKLSAVDKVSRVLGNVTKKLNPLKRKLQDTSNGFKVFQARTLAARQALSKFGKGAVSVGKKTSLAITAPIIGVGAAIIKSAASFEAGMNRVQALTGATGDQLGALTTQAKDLGRTTQFTASQAADAMGFLAMAGFDVDKILGAMPDTLNLAASAQIDLGQAADIVSNILTGYRLKTEDLGYANDVLVKTFTSTNTTLEMLGESFRKVGPIAATMSIPISETSALIGALGNAGIQAEEAGTGLRNMFLNLVKPASEAKEVLTRLKIPKSAIIDSEGRVKSLIDVIQLFEEAGASASDIATVFGKRAGPQFAALIGQGSKALRELKIKLEGAKGVTAKIAAVQMKGAAGAMKALVSAVEGLGLAIAASGLLQWFTDIVVRLTAFVQNLVKTNPEILKMATIIAMVVATVGPLLIVFGAMAQGLGALITLFGIVKIPLLFLGKSLIPMLLTALKFLAVGFIKLGIAILTTPVGWILAAIAAIAVGAYFLIKNWTKVKKFFLDLWDGPLGDFIKMFTPIGKLIALAKIVKRAWDPTQGVFKNLFNVVKMVFRESFDFIMNKIRALSSLLPDSIKKKLGFKAEAGIVFPGRLEGGAPKATIGGEGKSTKRIPALIVDFKNTPKGTIIKTEKSKGLDINVNTGLQGAAAM